MPINCNLKFSKSKEEISHYYVFKALFIQHKDAVKHCDLNNIPYDFIVKTHYYID